VDRDAHAPLHYEICVGGALDDHWTTWFDELVVTSTAPARTVLRGPLADQAALHGVLSQVRDLGLTLLSVRALTTARRPQSQEPTGRGHPPATRDAEKVMRAATVPRFGGPDVIEIADVPVPDPGPGTVRVRVAASAVNPIDLATRAGQLTQAGLLAPAPVLGLGWDVAGDVDAVGAGVHRFAVGDAVIGLRDQLWSYPGAHAEQVVLDASALARAPTRVSAVEAATIPLNALTADRALGLTGLRAGQTLLVTGAAGAVGGYVLELAAVRGILAVALAGAGDEALARSLGAAAFVPRTAPVGPAVRTIVPGGVDAVVDAAVIGIGAHDALRGEGTFVALVAPFAPPPVRGTRVLVQEVVADGARLTELAALVDAGLLTPRVADTMPLAEIAAAHRRIEAGGLRGRIVLEPHPGCCVQPTPPERRTDHRRTRDDNAHRN
jgi:NADPH2:quinone reductase